MRAWMRETRGTSWPDPRYRGVRHWHSRTIGVSAFWYGIGLLLYWCVAVPFFLLPLWCAVELFLLWLTLIIVLVGVLAHDRELGDIFIRRAGLFWVLDLDLS